MAGSDTRTRILDAALAVIDRKGLARLSLEDVAAEAGVSRQTVYRHVGGRDGLITATILREEEAFLDSLRTVVGQDRAGGPASTLRSTLAAAIRLALEEARRHPLLGRLLETEPAALLPFLIDGRGPVLSAARTVVVDLLGTWVPDLRDRQLDLVAEACTRLIVSYAISPPDDDLEALATGLARLIADGVRGGGAGPTVGDEGSSSLAT
jgi:AcrR family transcriptional regulator